MVKFLSQEWIDYGTKYIIEKLDPEKDLKNLTTSILAYIEHAPPNDTIMSFYLELKDGKINEFKVNTGDNIDETGIAYVVRANYGTYKDIFQGKTGIAMALLKNRLKLKGSKMEALKIIKQLEGIIESLRNITDEFDL